VRQGPDTPRPSGTTRVLCRAAYALGSTRQRRTAQPPMFVRYHFVSQTVPRSRSTDAH